MTPRSAVQAFADATGALVAREDLHDILTALLNDCLQVLPAQAAGVMVGAPGQHLELLGASSHAAAQLELFQIQADHGPCRDAIAQGVRVREVTADRIIERWGAVGAAIVAAGHTGVDAYPLRWQGRVLGGLNVFGDGADIDAGAGVVGQAFADVVSLLLCRNVELSEADVAERLRHAIAGRAVIEQAKGVLAEQFEVDLGAAYDRLVGLAEEQRLGLTSAAAAVIQTAQRGR